MLKPAQLAPTSIPWLNSISPLFPFSDMMWTLSKVLDYTPISHNTKHTGIDLTCRGIDSTRPLKVCCWYLAPLSPVSCEAQPLWIGLVFPVRPIDWDLGNLERIFAVWQEALSCLKRPLPLGHTVAMKGCTWSATLFVIRVKATSASLPPSIVHFGAISSTGKQQTWTKNVIHQTSSPSSIAPWCSSDTQCQ